MSITIGNSVTSIRQYAFYHCSSLTSITIPNSVTSIGDEAFRGCSGLKSVTIGNSVKSIGLSAFFGCRGLAKITIPNSVTSISDYAFYGCGRVYYRGTAKEWNKIYIGYSAVTTASLYYYSKTKPTESGNYWHYDADGVTPVIWKEEY